MNKQLGLLGGLGLGAGLMYLMDPQRGRRRRALARDQVVSLFHQTGGAAGPIARDLTNRAQGLLAETRNKLTTGKASDQVLAARVRSKLGRYVSHPSSINVQVHEGNVTLKGPILAHEVDNLLAAVAKIPGVENVENQMTVHESPGDFPGLQGESIRPGETMELFQETWAPATRFLMSSAGGALTVVGAKRRGLSGTFLSGLGLGMLTRGITNLELKRLVGIGAGRRAVDIQKTINIAAPVEEVYNFWSNFKNFPKFMSHVRKVELLGDGRSRWTVDGPAGTPISWDAVTTIQDPNRVLAWRSEAGTMVGNAGIIHFTPDAKGGTQIDIKLSYNPPAGALGHVVASFFGSDPKTAMDEDLVRLKTLIEQGKTTADGEQVAREDVASGGVRSY